MGFGKETCLICLKNNCDEKTLMLFDLGTLEWENVTSLNKLEFVLNAQIVVDESTLICGNCLGDLNSAYDFKQRVAKALQYWSSKFDEKVTIDKQNEVIDAVYGENNKSDMCEYAEFNVIENADDSPDNDKISELEDTNALNNDNTNDLTECSQFPCNKCNYIFLTTSELVNHTCGNLKIVKSKEEPPKSNKCTRKQRSDTFSCAVCELNFTKKWKLNKHLKAHTDDKKYVCKFCNRAFKQSYHLREHITSHTGEHNFTCSVCGKTFQRISSQKRHMRTHNALPGEKSKKSPFLCNICGKRFPYSNGAQRHMRIHTGDRRYECKICARKFNQSTHLKVHLRTHTGERPYMCSTCGGSFSIKASLDKHMKGHAESKNDVKILHNLEPNLSCTESREDSDGIKQEDCIQMTLYDHQGYHNMIACNQ